MQVGVCGGLLGGLTVARTEERGTETEQRVAFHLALDTTLRVQVSLAPLHDVLRDVYVLGAADMLLPIHRASVRLPPTDEEHPLSAPIAGRLGIGLGARY